MNTSTALRLGLFAFGAAAACAWAPAALADDGAQATLGGQVDVGGGQSWTVDELEPSHDAIPYQPAGSLWEAEATLHSTQGGVPVIPGFSARGGGVTYPVLWPVPTAEGVNPAFLAPGGSTEGKVYFDVTGPAPTAVTYTRDGRDVATWVEPPPAAGAPSSNYSPTPYSSLAPVTGGMPATTPKAPAAPAPAAGSSGTPLPAASGSAGTPLPAENSATTPAPAAGSSGTPASGSSGTPATGTQPSTAATSPAASPAPAAASPSAAAPTTAAAPAPTTPAAPSASAGTPLTAPTTTVVPVG